MLLSSNSRSPIAKRYVSFAILSLILLAAPAAVLAHAGHGNEFQGGNEASQSTGSIQVDAETAKRLGIKVEPVKRQRLAVAIKTTGQIETLPNQKVEVTAPITGIVVKLLAKPGDKVSQGQVVAVLSSAELAQLRVESVQKRADAEPDIQKAQADLRLARANLERQHQIAAADIEQASTEVKVAQEQYDRDKDLVNSGALPRRNMLESQAHLAEGKAKLTKATSRQEVLQAEAEVKRATAALEAAQSHLRLSDAAYQARLQQLSTLANAKGFVNVVAPISGTVADRAITPGESVTLEAGSKPLMTILNDSHVFATANIYEKDLDQVHKGQAVRVKLSSNRTFTGQITLIGSVVEGDTRVVPVKAELDNTDGQLKPGMFAELEVLTDRTPSAILAIPSSAVVEGNGTKLVYVQSGNAYQAVEVTLGQTSGDMLEVKTGLFEGDLIVTQRAPQLYAQSLRSGSKPSQEAGHKDKATSLNKNGVPLPWWWVLPVGGAIATSAFIAGRRTQPQINKNSALSSPLVEPIRGVAVGNSDSDAPIYPTEAYLHNSKQPTWSRSSRHVEEPEDSHQSHS